MIAPPASCFIKSASHWLAGTECSAGDTCCCDTSRHPESCKTFCPFLKLTPDRHVAPGSRSLGNRFGGDILAMPGFPGISRCGGDILAMPGFPDISRQPQPLGALLQAFHLKQTQQGLGLPPFHIIINPKTRETLQCDDVCHHMSPPFLLWNFAFL